MYSSRPSSSSPALKTSSLGIGMPTTRWMSGPVSLVILPADRRDLLHPPLAASGSERRRSVSPVGAASTTITS